MFDINTIDHSLTSNLPPSLERAAELLKKAMAFYQELKNQYLSGNPEEKKQAKTAALMIFARLDEEIRKVCETIGMPMEAFQHQIMTLFPLQDVFLYQEAYQFIAAHRDEFFAPAQSPKKGVRQPKNRLPC